MIKINDKLSAWLESKAEQWEDSADLWEEGSDQAASDRLQAIKFREAAKRLRNIPNCEDCQSVAELSELLIGCSPVTGTFKTPDELALHLRSLK